MPPEATATALKAVAKDSNQKLLRCNIIVVSLFLEHSDRADVLKKHCCLDLIVSEFTDRFKVEVSIPSGSS